MKLTLKNGTVIDVVDVEESYYPRNTQGVLLNIHLNSEGEIEELRDAFVPGALETMTVGEGDDVKTIQGYTQVDSIRKSYGGEAEYDTIATLLQAVLVAAVPVCAAFIGKRLKALAAYLGQKSESDIARKYLVAVADAVSTAVTYTSQTYVDALKKSGEFKKENQEWALKVAIAKAKTLLTEDAVEYLEAAYGSLERYLEGRIEAEVRNQKMGVGSVSVFAGGHGVLDYAESSFYFWIDGRPLVYRTDSFKVLNHY